jgi:regulation of enolase protein 1 (concanavalin A-like superfamily)
MIASGAKTNFGDETIKNLFLLNQELPKGDWTITARIKMPLQTSYEQVMIGIYDEANKWIRTSYARFDYNPHAVGIKVEKYAGKTYSYFQTNLFSDFDYPDVKKYNDEKMPFDLQLIKEGRKYRAKITSVVDNKIVHQTEDLTQLRVSGRPFIASRSRKDNGGEGTIDIDWFKIEAAE